MNAIQLREIEKRFGNKTAVHPMTMDIAEGEMFGLLGVNGARYILKVISTISAPTSTGIRA
ncbi:MAG: hypothetical protein E7662_08740 [Ruminococcaceae bacterium]|nr:hypothetical protein [Oscillospiraceae bacterium]